MCYLACHRDHHQKQPQRERERERERERLREREREKEREREREDDSGIVQKIFEFGLPTSMSPHDKPP
jgi:hypothetical protein